MKRFYSVLDPDDRVGTLQVNCTDEGVIVDLIDAQGEVIASWARTAQEFAEQLTERR